MKVVVGLGNPGSRYAGTRHNVGFVVIDALAKSSAAIVYQIAYQKRFEAEVAEMTEAEHKVLLVKPQTYMNLSGRCVRQVIDYYQVPLEDLLVVCDDINLPLGKVRARARGTHGGQNGLRDIQNHLGTTEYSRLRIGIGAPEGADAADYVLDRFRPAEKVVMEDAILQAVQGVTVWIREGIAECMNKVNARITE